MKAIFAFCSGTPHERVEVADTEAPAYNAPTM
jgi:hypothetical protein